MVKKLKYFNQRIIYCLIDFEWFSSFESIKQVRRFFNGRLSLHRNVLLLAPFIVYKFSKMNKNVHLNVEKKRNEHIVRNRCRLYWNNSHSLHCLAWRRRGWVQNVVVRSLFSTLRYNREIAIKCQTSIFFTHLLRCEMILKENKNCMK